MIIDDINIDDDYDPEYLYQCKHLIDKFWSEVSIVF